MARDHRRLAAIVSLDVAGYSRLMGSDDSGTLAALKAHRRELIDPKITEYGGRIVKTTGDGLLLEFPSVVDAVRCAVDVQRGMAERNEGIAPDRRLDFRIGINVGDIIIDGDDIFGDGVNVAARLQALSEPGGICVSRVVRDQVLDKLSFAFEDLGAQQVKNIARPVDVFRVDLGSGVPQARSGARKHWQRLTRRRRAAAARRRLARRRPCGPRGLGVATARDSAAGRRSTRAVGCGPAVGRASRRRGRVPIFGSVDAVSADGFAHQARIRSRARRICSSRCERRHACDGPARIGSPIQRSLRAGRRRAARRQDEYRQSSPGRCGNACAGLVRPRNDAGRRRGIRVIRGHSRSGCKHAQCPRRRRDTPRQGPSHCRR